MAKSVRRSLDNKENYGSLMQEGFADQLQNSDFVDLKIVLKGGQVKYLHQIVFAAASPMFLSSVLLDLFDVHETSTIELPRPISEPDLRRHLEALPANVVRAKGIAEGPDGERLLIQMVGRSIAIDPLPDAEAEPPTDLVVISVGHLD